MGVGSLAGNSCDPLEMDAGGKGKPQQVFCSAPEQGRLGYCSQKNGGRGEDLLLAYLLPCPVWPVRNACLSFQG